MQLQLARKVQLLLAVSVGFTLLVGGVGLVTLRTMGGIVDGYAGSDVPSLAAMLEMATSIAEANGAAAAVASDAVDAAAHLAAGKVIERELTHVAGAIKEFEAIARDGEAAAGWTEAPRLLSAWRAEIEGLVRAGVERDSKGAWSAEGAAAASRVTAAFDAVRKSSAELLDTLDRVNEAMAKTAEQRHLRAGATTRWATWGLVLVLIVAAGLLAAAGFQISRGVTRTVDGLKAQAAGLESAVAAGRIAARADASAVDLEFRPILEGMNATMEAFERPIRVAAGAMERIGRGEIPARLTGQYQGDFNLIVGSLNACIDAVNRLVADATALARAGVEGQLATRVDAARHQGDFRKVIQGVNDSLDAFTGPLGVAAQYVDGLSRGQVPPRITAAWAGDFGTLKANLNQCLEAVTLLVTDAGRLAQAGVEGKLATRADASRHQGDFRKVVEGFNSTLDAVVGPLGVAARCIDQISRGAIPAPIAEDYRGDFRTLKENLNGCIDAVNRLVADADALARGAVAGQLSARADASKHQGDFKKVVDGVNRTLDAVMAPVTEAAGVLEQLAGRDLRARVRGSYQGDHVRIKESVNATAEALESALAQVAAAVEQVSTAATQIASSSQAVASGASQQAAALQETTSTIESVSATTKHAADSAEQANRLAQKARAAASDGSSAVAQMQGAMSKIKASAEGTSQIIKDVSDIAFQTNLLALNAAVEAARAGEAGRGFAVVAEEVRSLALRAKEAARKTEELIRQSVREAGEGEQASLQVAGKLGEIVIGVGQVTDIVSQIAVAARQQAAGIDQVSRAVGEMEKVTQQNAASAEQSSSATSELSAQSEELAAMIGAFRLDRVATAAAARAGGRPARPPRLAGGSPGAARSRSNGAATPRAGPGDRQDTTPFPMDDDAPIRDF
jgi:methyl-accepting chemotaxis protein